MPTADHRFLALSERFLRRRAPGRALARLAATSLPLVAVERIAARAPEPGLADLAPTPLVWRWPWRRPGAACSTTRRSW
jgi:hypothetical protein